MSESAQTTPVAPKRAPVHAPMSHFIVQGGELIVGGQPLSLLAERVGQTPFYAYDRKLLRARVAALRQALPARMKLHYAMKANPMPAVVALMAGLVDGIDVASAGELKVALDAGADPAEISFAGPGKRDVELRQAVAAGVLINVESFRELPVLNWARRAISSRVLTALTSAITCAWTRAARASNWRALYRTNTQVKPGLCIACRANAWMRPPRGLPRKASTRWLTTRAWTPPRAAVRRSAFSVRMP